MSRTIYTASKSRSARPGWSATFRHPVRRDSRGAIGLKVRRGLGTADDDEADRLIAQLNILLSDERWWNGDRRADAEHEFDPRVVSAFFDGIESGAVDSEARRESLIPLPSREEGYSRILFLGTTGAGKTTLLRHVIGSDAERDRFPSTSTARTTTADIEIVTAQGEFRAAVTFMPEHEVRAHIDECLEDACLEAVQGKADAKIAAALLEHREQRFRLSYILGGWGTDSESDADQDFAFEDDAPSEMAIKDAESVSDDERRENLAALREYVDRVKAIVADVEATFSGELGRLAQQKGTDDRAAWLEMFGSEVFKDPRFSELALDIMDGVSTRFSRITSGKLEHGPTGWPIVWTHESGERDAFLADVRWFSSNHHQMFGRLLTPLVNGMRVQGPLYPSGLDVQNDLRLVLLDGQGLGHTATSVSSVSTRITDRFDAVDMILLVDNAQQPMQAAPLALMRAIGSSGFADKLTIAFTHFDQVKGANLGTFDQKRGHILGSVSNAVLSLRDVVGAGVAGAIERQIDSHAVFLGGLDRPTDKLPSGFLRELSRLISLMQNSANPRAIVDCFPSYEFKGLEIAMHDAIDAFRNPWGAKLGLRYHDGIAKEHWTRIKALSRRLANKSADEYDNLTPVADLLARLQEEASKWLDRPVDWNGPSTSEVEREAALDRIRRAVFSRLRDLTKTRLTDEQLVNWREAYDYTGHGSAARRARMIDDIHERAAPRISASMSADARSFLADLYVMLREAIEEAGGKIVPVGAAS